MQRATKIVATIGPASSSPEILLQMMQAGLDVVRLNFRTARPTITASAPRWCARPPARRPRDRDHGRPPARKIRVGKFENGKTTLEPGQAFILDAGCELGNDERVGPTTRSCRVTCARATCCC